MFTNVSIFFLGSAIKLQDIKTEPSSIFLGHPFGSMSNESRQGLVSVAITLRPAAAEVGMPLCLVSLLENTAAVTQPFSQRDLKFTSDEPLLHYNSSFAVKPQE